MTKELIVIACMLLVAVNAGVILSHPTIPNYYVHSGDYHEWIPFPYVTSAGTLNSMQYPVVIPRHAVNGDVNRWDYDTVEGRNRDDQDNSYGEATIPNIRMFHFVLKLVRSMRKHFLPVYATNPEDISNIYVQYENDKRR